MKKTPILLILIALTAALAQQVIQVGLSTPAPPPAQATAVTIGNPGNTTYTYYVITNYPAGSVVSAPAVVQFAPVTLTSGNYIQIGWNPVAGATSYDVVRAVNFSGSCTTCAVATGLTVNSAKDTGAALGNYTSAAPATQGNGTLYINTREYRPPQMRQVVNGVDMGIGTPGAPGPPGPPGPTQFPSVLAYGADPTGVACSEDAFTAAGAAIPSGGTLIMPTGNYRICNPITFTGLYGAHINGYGYSTQLNWTGGAGQCAINFTGNADSWLQNFSIYATSANPLKCGVQYQQGSATSQANHIWGLQVRGPGNYTTDGILGSVGTNANNNDVIEVAYSRISSVSNSAVNLASGGQQYYWYIHDNPVLGSTTTTAAVIATPYMGYCGNFIAERNGTASTAGGYDYDIGGGANCTIAGFPITIRDVESETSGGLVRANGYGLVSVDGGRFFSDPGADTLIFNFLSATSLTVNNLQMQIGEGFRGTFFFNSTNFGQYYPRFQVSNSTLVGTAFTYSQLMPSGFAQPQDFGLRWSDPGNANSYYFFPQTYSTGTITATNGSTAITGAGTTFLASWITGGGMAYLQTCNSACTAYQITAVGSATSITLGSNYTGTGGAGLAYTIGFGAAANQLSSLNVGGTPR